LIEPVENRGIIDPESIVGRRAVLRHRRRISRLLHVGRRRIEQDRVMLDDPWRAAGRRVDRNEESLPPIVRIAIVPGTPLVSRIRER